MKKRALQTVLIVSVRLLVAIGGIAHFGVATAQMPAPDDGVSTPETGIYTVSALDEPARLRKLEEKDIAGYLMVYFNDQTQSAYMAISRDGYTFMDVNQGRTIIEGKLLAAQKGVCDPHITRGADGAFYVGMTDLHIFGQRTGFRTTQRERRQERYGWGNNRAILLMKSWDLIHWAHSDFRVEMAFPELGDIDCSWAPETIYDPAIGKIVVYFTIRYNNKGCNLYYSNADSAFTKLEAKAKLIAGIGGLDGDNTHVRDKFHMFCVSIAQVKHAVSDQINGG